MYLLLTDETNVKPSKRVKFFVYGGIIFPINALLPLHNRISEIRREFGYKPCDELKFGTHTRPDNVSKDEATNAKREVIKLCKELDVTFIVSIVHHGVIKNQPMMKHIEWSANQVLGRANRFLIGKDSHGICLIDNLPNKSEFGYLKEKFTLGLVFPSGNSIRLDRLISFGSTCINASNANSAMDIILGSFRYCINDPENQEAAAVMMKEVAPMLWHRKEGNTLYVRNKGLIIRPKNLEDFPKFQPYYESLLDEIKNLFAG